MSDDGSSDQFSIEYDAPRMEINVETLTGTSFELLISPTDTIGSIKHRIQRVEGIPVVQQHLLFRLKELNNDDRLCDHGVTAGSTLRLVLSMRGGPVSTRRVPTTEHELAWREIKEYVDSTREDMIDKLPPGSKMSMFLFRDEENIHLIRVVENEDGTCYPYTDTWPPPKSKSKEKGKTKHRERTTENHALMHKIAELRRQMEGLSLQKKARKPASNSTAAEYIHSDSCTSGVRARAVATAAAAASAASEHSKSRPLYTEPTLVENSAEPNRSPLSETLESLRKGKSLAEIYSERLLLLEQRRNSRSHIGRSHRPQRVDPTRSKSDKPLLSARNCTIQTPSIAILEEEAESTFNKKETDYSPSSAISVASGEANTVTMSQIPSLPGTSRNLLHLAHMPRHHMVLQEHTADRPKSSPDTYEQDAQQFCNVLFNEATERSHNTSATAAAAAAATSSGTGTVKLSVTNRRQSLDYTPAASSSKTNLSRMQFASSSNPRIDSLEKSFTTAGGTDDTVTYSRATLYNTTSNLLTSQFASTSKLNSAHLDNILGNRVSTSSESGDAKFNNDVGGGGSTTRSPVYGRRARIERIRNNVTENSGGNTEKYGYSNLGYIANIEKIQNDAVSINKQVSQQYSRRNLNFVSNLESRNTCDPTSYELRPFKLPRRRYDASPAAPVPAVPAQQRQQDVKKTIQEDVVHNTSTGSNCETLPAIVATKPARSRCAFCKKRLNLTTIHTCRCGGMFCSQHRYSEVHECHYDYKTEGRKFLEQANPLVAAPKLPKI